MKTIFQKAVVLLSLSALFGFFPACEGGPGSQVAEEEKNVLEEVAQAVAGNFFDADGDGFGDPNKPAGEIDGDTAKGVAKSSSSLGTTSAGQGKIVSNGGDCDDTNPKINPESTIPENLDGTIDFNCDGVYYFLPEKVIVKNEEGKPVSEREDVKKKEDKKEGKEPGVQVAKAGKEGIEPKKNPKIKGENLPKHYAVKNSWEEQKHVWVSSLFFEGEKPEALALSSKERIFSFEGELLGSKSYEKGLLQSAFELVEGQEGKQIGKLKRFLKGIEEAVFEKYYSADGKLSEAFLHEKGQLSRMEFEYNEAGNLAQMIISKEVIEDKKGDKEKDEEKDRAESLEWEVVVQKEFLYEEQGRPIGSKSFQFDGSEKGVAKETAFEKYLYKDGEISGIEVYPSEDSQEPSLTMNFIRDKAGQLLFANQLEKNKEISSIEFRLEGGSVSKTLKSAKGMEEERWELNEGIPVAYAHKVGKEDSYSEEYVGSIPIHFPLQIPSLIASKQSLRWDQWLGASEENLFNEPGLEKLKEIEGLKGLFPAGGLSAVSVVKGAVESKPTEKSDDKNAKKGPVKDPGPGVE